MLAWPLLEAALRLRLYEAGIPVERLPTKAVFDHAYSNGQISFEQHKSFVRLLPVRNGLAHGMKSDTNKEQIQQFAEDVAQLVSQWSHEGDTNNK